MPNGWAELMHGMKYKRQHTMHTEYTKYKKQKTCIYEIQLGYAIALGCSVTCYDWALKLKECMTQRHSKDSTQNTQNAQTRKQTETKNRQLPYSYAQWLAAGTQVIDYNSFSLSHKFKFSSSWGSISTRRMHLCIRGALSKIDFGS